jgi:signal transduction histidine kinase/CheY-like chemotaxis protein
MTGKKIIFYILAAFIAGNLLLIYIQYNSAKNIITLIKGNEKLLEEFRVSSELKELEKDILSVEGKITGTVSTKDSSYIEGLDIKISEVEGDLGQLQKISDDDSSVKYIDELDYLVHKKLLFSRQILDSFHAGDKTRAENLIAAQQGKKLTDSIILVIQVIDSTRQKLLANVTSSIDESGKKAQQFGTILIVLVLISGAALFWYVINTIRKQIQLIQQLNISERKVRESAQVKENFMANMSHEIRTPMNAILGFTNLLQRKNLDAESKEYVQTIQKSGENLLTIINDILDLSKIEAGMMRIESAPFSIRGLTHSIQTMFKSKAVEKNLHLSTTVDKSVPDTLIGDATRLTQILANLIGNALKFTGKGTISVKITNEGIIGNTIKAGITITDTGIGIEKEKLEPIFERFQQAEDSITRKYGGTGLGLSIVNDLVLLQHGSIAVESEPGIGTTFRLIVPYKISADQISPVLPFKSPKITQEHFENTLILVVEDNEINQSLIKHLFNGWQLEFNLADNGKAAIDQLQQKKYDLILMDIQMPEMDGYTATRKIRTELKLDTPIIAMTAHALSGEREKCLSYGMDEYISKPIEYEQLYKLIARFTQKNKPFLLQKTTSRKVGDGPFKYINLQYMKEVSMGNADYEKTVTEQFIDTIPGDLLTIENAWQENDIPYLQQVAHNMKTTVSVMGLNDLLQPYLDALEYDNLDEDIFQQNYGSVRSICEASVQEAKQFYSTF